MMENNNDRLQALVNRMETEIKLLEGISALTTNFEIKSIDLVSTGRALALREIVNELKNIIREHRSQ